jgi:hypothetical protein
MNQFISFFRGDYIAKTKSYENEFIEVRGTAGRNPYLKGVEKMRLLHLLSNPQAIRVVQAFH